MAPTNPRPPPLSSIRVIELAGLAPAPFASLLLADYGASVLRIDRPHPLAHSDPATLNPPSPHRSRRPPPTPDLLTRHKRSIALDLKNRSALALLKSLLQHADVLVDPFRPGVLESLDLDPQDLLKLNPRLIIARLTGFRREEKTEEGKRKDAYARMAGHDINYLAVSGVLSQLGRKHGPPYAPGNLLADFAGGGAMCALGVLMALFEREREGKGQVVDVSMVDGVGYLGTFLRFARRVKEVGGAERGENLLDGGAPWYEVYECKDEGGRKGYMAVGALEGRFYGEFVRGLGVEEMVKGLKREDRGKWGDLRRVLEKRFKERTRREWERVFEGTDACVTPVLGLEEMEEGGYEHRLPVGLNGSPGMEIGREEGWRGKGLAPGEGGEEVLGEWVGWKPGKDYRVEQGGLVLVERPKL
ncbi:MAG: hypothetical protein LQ342_006486 [Letrouitia transgressa]|nr:MAG: hypothetical protein LQ342_006486 [Letrouitia transgressa]